MSQPQREGVSPPRGVVPRELQHTGRTQLTDAGCACPPASSHNTPSAGYSLSNRATSCVSLGSHDRLGDTFSISLPSLPLLPFPFLCCPGIPPLIKCHLISFCLRLCLLRNSGPGCKAPATPQIRLALMRIVLSIRVPYEISL